MNEILRLLFLRIQGLFSRSAARHRVHPHVWKRTSQEKEWEFHAANQWRRSRKFVNDNIRLWQYFGFKHSEMRGCTVIDFGAGSKLRSRFFKEARIIAIEPLADRFRALEFCDLDQAAEVYSQPGEERIEALVAQADLIVSINVLDHCFDFDKALSNIAAYLRPSGTAFLSFDLHEEADELHPLLLTEESCKKSFVRAGLVTRRRSEGVGPLGVSYGHGRAINFWLGLAEE